MDFLDPKKKRSQKRRLYIGYVLMAIAIILGSFILLFAAYGYSFSRSGEVFQNGLVFLSSRPGGAQAVIENEQRDFRQTTETNTRVVLREGSYRVTLSRQGYRNWQRDFTLEGGGIERMVYPLLFPSNLETSTLAEYKEATTFTTTSPDRRWIVIGKPGALASFDIVDGNADKDNQPVKSFSLPSGLLTASSGKQSLELVEWSTDNVHMLVKHTYGKTYEYIVINHDEPSESFNVNKTFDGSFHSVMLRDKKFNEFYLLEKRGGQLLSGTIKDAKTERVANNVLAFKPHGRDMLLFATPDTSDKKSTLVRVKDKDKTYTLRKLPVGDDYLLDLAQFENKWYMAAGTKDSDFVYVYKNPLDWLANPASAMQVSARTLRVKGANWLGFSANTRFIAVRGGQNFGVYDAETERQYSYQISDQLSGKVQWMDGHRLSGVSNGQAVVFDFDGINLQRLSNAVDGTAPMFDRDYEELYTFAPNNDPKNKFALTRTELIVEE